MFYSALGTWNFLSNYRLNIVKFIRFRDVERVLMYKNHFSVFNRGDSVPKTVLNFDSQRSRTRLNSIREKFSLEKICQLWFLFHRQEGVFEKIFCNVRDSKSKVVVYYRVVGGENKALSDRNIKAAPTRRKILIKPILQSPLTKRLYRHAPKQFRAFSFNKGMQNNHVKKNNNGFDRLIRSQSHKTKYCALL